MAKYLLNILQQKLYAIYDNLCVQLINIMYTKTTILNEHVWRFPDCDNKNSPIFTKICMYIVKKQKNNLYEGFFHKIKIIVFSTLVCRINVPARSVFFVFLPAGTFIYTRHDPMFTSTRHDYLGNILSSNVPACQIPPGTL